MKKLAYFVGGSCVGFVIGAVVNNALLYAFTRPETSAQILDDLNDRAAKARATIEFNKIVNNQ